MENLNTMSDVIQKIIQDYGEQALLDPRLLTTAFAENAPTMKKEAELLQAFLQCNGPEKLIQVKNSSVQDQRSCMENLIHSLKEEQWVAENAARYVCSEFYRGITGYEWGSDAGEDAGSAGMNLDVHKSISILPPETLTNRSVSVDVDGRKVSVLVPEHVVSGQVVCFPKKGKRSGSTGRAGNLYLTIHIVNSPRQIIPLKKVLIAAAAVIALVAAGSFIFGSRDNGTAQGNASANHTHSWEEATCMAPKSCTVCGETSGSPVNHQWQGATCTDPETCVLCGQTNGGAIGHQWQDATYDAPKTCSVCSATEGVSLKDQAEQEKDAVLELARSYAGDAQYRLAIQVLDEAWDEYGEQVFYDMAAEYRQAFALFNSSQIAAGKYNSILRYQDGTVLIVGDSGQKEMNANYWADIAYIAIGDRHVMGLHSDGTVEVEGESIQHNARYWNNVVMICAGDVHSVALKENGTLVTVGYSNYNQGNVSTLTRLADEYKIVAISAGYHQTLALLENGRVVACGDNSSGACDVSTWRDIAAIYTGTEYSAGLKTDGTVVVTKGNWDVSDWTDIVTLAAGDYYLLGLKSDGTVLAVGEYRKYGNIDVSDWENIVQISAGHDHAIGIDADGYLVCTGSNAYGQFFEKGTNIYD